VVITEFYDTRVPGFEPETNPPLIVDRDRVLTEPVLDQRMESVTRRHSQIVEARGRIDRFELAQGAPYNVGRDASRPPCHEELVRAPIRKRLDRPSQ
jgi:hypothetical protein